MIKNFFYINIFILFFINLNLLYSIEAPKKLYIKDVELSNLELKVELNDELFVHYEGWIFDRNINTKDYCSAKGNKFDSSKEKPFRPQPKIFNFKIGKGLLIPGWELGLLEMKKGSKRCLVIPHQLAYGHRSFDKIPPYSTLIFEIELIEINKNNREGK
ncbi:MAG: FK506-binding protein [Alphaproteobacteria bacterium MarineAlpha9_Bin4]|nr:hypothetical protein [Pelagibacterales bacterium]PPR27201.1 MAG: FK506-binding protein [Alphaproteobacteria bacterium MarineAlpha9_Bin4]|tara:strand:- start:4117 stop:4593 length:477 start_codon:yes stop_codon:yes gene_type:complete